MSDVNRAPLTRPTAIEVDEKQADLLTHVEEGQYSDVKSIAIMPAKLGNTIAAFANTDRGDLYIGISEQMLGGNAKKREWAGFPDVEAANGHLQAFERAFPLGKDFQYEFLRCPKRPGVVLHVQVSRTQGIIKGTDGKPYIRRGAQNLPQDTAEQLRRLEFTKGVISFEGRSCNLTSGNLAERVGSRVGGHGPRRADAPSRFLPSPRRTGCRPRTIGPSPS